MYVCKYVCVFVYTYVRVYVCMYIYFVRSTVLTKYGKLQHCELQARM